MVTVTLLILFAYACGSVPFGKLMGRLRGVDIQQKGSGNIGFANAVRVLGWPAGVAVLVGDVTKGYVPVLVAQQFVQGELLMLVGLAAIAGHLFPVWLKGRGGKGIATGLGITLALSPVLALLGVAAYLIVFAAFKKSAPASVVGACLLPMFSLALLPFSFSVFYTGLALLAIWTHRSNIHQHIRQHHVS